MPVILIAILCASLGLTAVPHVQGANSYDPVIMGPYNINREAFIEHGLKEHIDLGADTLYRGAPYVFYARVPNPGFGIHFSFEWGDGKPSSYVDVVTHENPEGDNDPSITYGSASHTWDNPGDYTVKVTAIYFVPGYPPFPCHDNNSPSVSDLDIHVNNKPVLDPDPATGNKIYGPYKLDGTLVSPNALVLGTWYRTRIHAYHLTYDKNDVEYEIIPENSEGFNTGWGVFYYINWGDNTEPDTHRAIHDGEKNLIEAAKEAPPHLYCSPGTYTISAKAGWYPLSNPDAIIWSDTSYLTVTVTYDPPNYPPIPDFFELTVYARDENNNLLTNGDVYVDGYIAAEIGEPFHVVSSNWLGRLQAIGVLLDSADYTFDHFTVNGVSYGDNPVYLDITEDLTLTAYYEPTQPPPVQHSVTVLAYFEYYGGYDNGGYIELDGAGAGFAPNTFSVSEGTHQIKVNDIDYYYFLAKCDWLTYNGNTVYGNEVTLAIDSDITITAHYVFYGYY